MTGDKEPRGDAVMENQDERKQEHERKEKRGARSDRCREESGYPRCHGTDLVRDSC